MRVSVSYRSLGFPDVSICTGFPDVSICTIVVHGPLGQLVLSGPLGLGYEYGRHPILTQGIPSFCILNQPVDVALKILIFL
jgi:hypothetical protein